MPGSYTILPQHRFVYTRAWGVLTEAAILAHAHALRRDPRFEPSFAQLSDLAAVTDLAATSDGMRKIAAATPFGAGTRRAVVASSDLIFGMARMYEMIKNPSGDEVMVFRDAPAALRWLGTRAPADWHDIPVLSPDWLLEAD